MPPKKKKGRPKKTNKKKKGNNRAKNSQATNLSSNAKSSNGIGKRSRRSKVLEGELPNFQEFESRSILSERKATIYTRYKQATKRFVTYMMENTPVEVRGERVTADSIAIAADWMYEQKHALPPSILKDLKLAIRLRAKVSKTFYKDGDAGHQHFLLVLSYCWTFLSKLPKSHSPVSEMMQNLEDDTVRNHNRFSPFEDLEHEETDDEEFFPSNPIPRPVLAHEPLTIDELMEADYRTDAYLFLLNMDELMGFVSEQYKVVANNHVGNRQLGYPDSVLVEPLLEAAVATNMVIQKVQQMEMELQIQHKHLTTPYRLFATMIFPEMTKNVVDILQEHSFSKPSNEEIVALCFVGDCIECYFRNPSDENNRKDVIVQAFCTEYQINNSGCNELLQLFKGMEMLVRFEVPIGPEMEMNSSFQPLLDMMGGTLYQGTKNPSFQTHCWLDRHAFIGKNRSIDHTIRLMQALGSVISDLPEHKQLIPVKGWFGPKPWHPGRSHKIQQDFDELLMTEIMPSWIMMCRKGIIGSQKLPKENDMCPLFVLLRTYVENPGKPVTWSFAFAIHSLLTSILETDKIFNDVLNVSKFSFDNYFLQMTHVKDTIYEGEKDSFMDKASAQNLLSINFLQNLGNDIFDDRAIWNPLCGGTSLSYICYFGNLEAGSTLIDNRAQLRIVLHLYHALLMNGIIKKDQIPLIDVLYDTFKTSRAIWEGSLPKKGDFVQRFWTCYGTNVKDARHLAEGAKLGVESNKESTHLGELNNFSTQCLFRKRKMKAIDSAEISKSFRRLWNQDFHDVVDNYHTPEQRHPKKDGEVYEVAVRVNDTLDAIDEEQVFLSKNLVVFGAHLEQFLCSLSRILQWDSIISVAMTSDARLGQDKRQGFVHFFAQYLLGVLDFSNDPSSHIFLEVPMVEVSVSFMETYFLQISPELLNWFSPTQYED